MNLAGTRGAAAMIGLVAAIAAPGAMAETITANCTGMFNLDVYVIDAAKSSQEVAGVGLAEVTITEEAILLVGSFGEVRFDLKVGTLYKNGSDTGIYCTYARS
ncbi:MAG: hypothetical protein FJX19_05935 [Alphaproteobacteria bacterium]|nr:hypothetical protein [Alphaproteobacteria bacterium]